MWGFAAAGFALALFLSALVSPLASSAPDGLERVAEQAQFLQLADGQQVWEGAMLPDYAVQGVEAEGVSTGLAGLLGTTAVFAVGFGVFKLLGTRSARQAS